MKASNGRSLPGTGALPRFEYYFETMDQPVGPGHPAWLSPLPLSRRAHPESGYSEKAAEGSMTIADYFRSVELFLMAGGGEAMARRLVEEGRERAAPSVVRIFLAKHGEYYHPARVETLSGVGRRTWVVNVAVSAAGKSLLSREYELLKRLNREYPASYLPAVYASGEAEPGRGRSALLFLGDWFTGYHEFHLSRSGGGSEPALVFWDPRNGAIPAGPGQTAAIYREVGRVLTHYFNLNTFEGIGDWHHAAGDFVARPSADSVEVRLISVRRYAPLFRIPASGAAGVGGIKTLLEALVVFLLNISLRTRLDRLDGTGAMAWSGAGAVAATVQGVMAALADKSPPVKLPLPLDRLFAGFLSVCSKEDLLDLCSGIAATYSPSSSEAAVLRAHLKEHVDTLADAFRRF